MTQESHQREPSLCLKYHQPVSAPKLGSRVLDWKMAHESAYGYNCFSSAAQSSSSMQGFDASHHGLFELQAGMEMLGIPKAEGNLMEYSTSWQQQNRMLVENQGLSLSLPHHQQNYQQEQEQEQQMSMMDARFYQTYQLKNSMYVIPAQELLNEFCNLEGVSNQRERKLKSKEGESSSTPPSWNQSFLFSMDASELQKLKAKLLSMLEEVDTRYKRYCNQMRAVVSTFETVAGKGSATVYSNLASKAMSRHFRYLRDGIVSQIKATKKAMGEKDPVVPGTTKGETPRLKLLDQCIRQQKSLQQGGAMESHPWRPQRGLPERSVTILRAWLFEHFLHPYPSDVDKHILARQTGLSRSQVSNWFINARVRLWKPMVEEMYMEETKEQDNQQSSQGTPECESNDNNSRPNSILLHSNRNANPNPRSSLDQDHDHKPFSSHPHIESDSLTSMINKHQVPIVDLDFSAYNESSSSHNFGNGVSLTLGLQQHTGGGMSLSFSPTNQQTMFFSREQMEDCQPVQFSILDGEGQNLPYRNLMEAQMLHDLAG